VVALINDALLNAGKKPGRSFLSEISHPLVGAMNPALYKIGASTPKAFVDVTSGNNANDCCQGFNAQAGWVWHN
jgi:hypothetical protein